MIDMMGNMFGRRRDLRMTIMAVLRNGPKNGASIMDSIEKMTFGFWRPSPGSLYPMLQNMVEEGTIRKDSDGLYSLTDESETAFRNPFSGHSPRNFDEALEELRGIISFLEDIKANGSKKFQENGKKLEELALKLKELSSESKKE